VHGDAVRYLTEMSADRFDVVLTSPPFKTEDVDGEYWQFYDAVQQEILRVTRRVAFVIQSATHLNTVVSRYEPDRTLIWGKQVSQYPYRYNPILCFQVDAEYNVNKRIWTDALGIPSVPPGSKTQKYQDPVRLYRTILEMVSDCDTVLDPFVGSGTSMVAARQVGMDAVGVDRDENCLATARERLHQQTLTTSTDVQMTTVEDQFSGTNGDGIPNET